MKKYVYLFLVILCVACNKHLYGAVLQTENEVSSYIGQRVSVNGRIVHVCPVAGKLLKFQLSDNAYLQVLPPIGTNFIVNKDSLNNRSVIYAHDTLFFTKEEWMQKEIVLQGTISEKRLSKQYIDSIYQVQILPCHINYEECIDEPWKKNMKLNKRDKAYVEKQHQILTEKMEQTGKNYISIYTLQL